MGSFQFLNADRSQSMKNAKIRKLGIQKKFRIIDESVIDGLMYNAKFLLYVLNKYSPVGFNAKKCILKSESVEDSFDFAVRELIIYVMMSPKILPISLIPDRIKQ